MKKYYSDYYNSPIQVDNISGDIIVTIETDKGEQVIYSWYDLIDKTSYSPYIKNSILASFIGSIPINILVIGFGGGAYAKYFKEYLGNKVNISGIEIDSVMIDISKNELNLKEINYYNMDYINALEILNKKNKFDTIFIDIYDNNSKIPISLNDKYTLNLIKNVLNGNGKIIINYANFEINNNFFNEIKGKLIDLFGNIYIEILNGKNDNGNIIGVYNLDEKYNSEKVVLDYLKHVQNGELNYDSNLISKIYLK